MPETMVLKDREVTSSLFGFPISTSDIFFKRVIWQKTQVQNDDHKTGMRNEFNRSIIQSNIDFEFTKRIYNIYYFNWLDILSTIGGLRTSIITILGYMMPLVTLHFLIKLAGIIDIQMHKFQEMEMF